ncbi:MAG: diaminopimelate epimerase [Rhodospirillales bacterium]|nr:diaminopimelate epimerase [Alphaproteobacteria bacterium]USO03109.1 MAG: diaminopimelate epimerase [Rhodospirillales bacterium]
MLKFKKMHGLGNDFVIMDGRGQDLNLTPERIARIADRQRGVGCDQFIVIETPEAPEARAFMRIYNPDGTQAGACGNATRCVADILMQETGEDHAVIETVSGLLSCVRAGEYLVTVDMGPPRLAWRDIPLSKECDTLHLPLEGDPVAVSMGNPHCVFFVEDAENAPLEEWGPRFEKDLLFPEKTNVEFVEVKDRQHLRMRVWERGAGVTQACGSGACAAGVAAVRRGLTDRKVAVTLDGGDLVIEWREEDGHVLMTGPYAYVFDGRLEMV